MASSFDVPRVQFDEVTAAAVAGVRRALAARARGNDAMIPGPIIVGVISYPDGPRPPLPPEFPFPDQEPIPFSARDHTVIIESLVRHAIPVIKALGASRDRSVQFTGRDVLKTLHGLDPGREVRDLIEVVLKWLDSLSQAEDRIDPAARDSAERLSNRVREARSIDEQISVLEQAADEDGRDTALGIGARTAAAILRDGRTTIYNPDFYTEVLGGGVGPVLEKDAATEVGGADVSGCVGGAVAGAVATTPTGPGGLAGAAAGCVAGGVASSAGKVVDKILDAIFD